MGRLHQERLLRAAVDGPVHINVPLHHRAADACSTHTPGVSVHLGSPPPASAGGPMHEAAPHPSLGGAARLPRPAAALACHQTASLQGSAARLPAVAPYTARLAANLSSGHRSTGQRCLAQDTDTQVFIPVLVPKLGLQGSCVLLKAVVQQALHSQGWCPECRGCRAARLLVGRLQAKAAARLDSRVRVYTSSYQHRKPGRHQDQHVHNQVPTAETACVARQSPTPQRGRPGDMG